jgi:membrane protein required for colicin V production
MIRAALRGFINEAMTMVSLVLGLLAGLIFDKNGALFLRGKVPSLAKVQILPEILAFLAIFMIVFLIVHFVNYILKDIVDRIEVLGGVDHLLGLVFGLLEGLTITALVLLALKVQPLFDAKPFLAKSLFAKTLLPIISGFSHNLPTGAGGIHV